MAKRKQAERAHAVLSASSADRWLNCTPSAVMCDKAPKESNAYADEGTLAHKLAEIAIMHLLRKTDVEEYTKQINAHRSSLHWYDDIMKDLEPYVMHVVEQIKLPGAVWELEKRTDLTAFVPDGFGTTDAKVIADGVLYINDLKFGRGVRVSAENNSQLKLYASGALLEFNLLYDIHTVRLAIVQPRLDAISTWDIDPEELLAWAEKVVKPTAKIASKGEGKHKTGSWCQFCNAKVMCPAIKKEALASAIKDFSIEDEKLEARNLDLEEEWEDDLLEVYLKTPRIREYLDAVASYMYTQALKGKKWPGLKLVAGQSKREIVDPDGAIDALEAEGLKETQYINKKIKGIGELEKLLGDFFDPLLGKFIEKPKGKPTLVEASDKRPEISSANDFD